MKFHEPNCEVTLDRQGNRPCPEPLFTVVPLPGGTGIFVCALHARHLSTTGELQ